MRSRRPMPPQPAQQQSPPGLTRHMDPVPDHGENSYRGSGKLEGKVALITGADSGIGRAVAIAYAREGADIVLSYLDEHEDAEATRQLIVEAGKRALVVAGDISSEQFCQQMVEKTIGAFGRLDILVNNAAFQRTYADIADISEQEWDETFRTNIYAPFFLAKAAVPHLRPGSAIINTTSIQSRQPSAHLLAYASTKGAVSNFTAGLAEMLADRGIRVNAVAPGPIWTPLIPASFPPDKVDGFGESAPLGRAGQPNEVAPSMLFLACADSSYMTGQVLHPNGGDLIGG